MAFVLLEKKKQNKTKQTNKQKKDDLLSKNGP